MEVDEWDDSEQILHARFSSPLLLAPFFVSVAYGKCTRVGRIEMWDKLRGLDSKMDGFPWLVGGDFNTFVTEEERQGGRKKRTREMSDFAETISDCQLLDVGADGPKFTWARGEVFERLDRVLLSEGWSSLFEVTGVTNLPRVLSDHCPLLIVCRLPGPRVRAAFRFQNMWVRHHLFLQEVDRCWKEETGTRGMIQLKLSRLKRSLKLWNHVVFGNIFERVKMAEIGAKEALEKYELNASLPLRAEMNRLTAEYLLKMKMEEDFWRQKAALKWVSEEERNTRFFQGWVKQKRVKSRIHMIEDGGKTLTEDGDIRSSAENFFRTCSLMMWGYWKNQTWIFYPPSLVM
ncbi:uncharacterized protein LOC125206162 [Salvia hispanica]|uniref:uncharacterized protein LOC125206162 n=1 Tax=Salvia hispanica TaxID=49212 RepID=UPI0020093C12|nr:uncharacterized protein LOC125206162 [Salvia hispanica]